MLRIIPSSATHVVRMFLSEVRMKGQPEAEKRRILAIAGNPTNGQVQPLYSIPGSFRILSRSYHYNHVTKRGDGNKKTVGVVIGDQYLPIDEYHKRYTRMGRLRPVIAAEPVAQDPSPAAVIPPVTEPVTPPEDGHDSVAQSSVPTCHTPDSTGLSSIESSSELVETLATIPSGSEEMGYYQRTLGPVPILYQSAVNCGIIEDLLEAYGSRELVNEILSLAFHWLIDADNVARRYPDFSSGYVLPHLGRMEEDELAQFYSSLSRMQHLTTKLFGLRLKRLPEGSIVSYDSTTIPTVASDIWHVQDSLSKDGVIEPLEHLALLVDHRTRLPLMYQLFGGATPDNRNFSELLSHLNNLACRDDGLSVFDRGYETLENLFLATEQGHHVLMAVRDKNQDEIARAFASCTDMWEASTNIPETTVHGRTVPVQMTFNDRTLKLWVHVYRDIFLTSKEEASFLSRLDKFERKWRDSSLETRRDMLGDPTIHYYQFPEACKELERDCDAIDNHLRFSGYFANISNVELSCADAYNLYKQRDCIEKCFKSGKMRFKLDTARSHRTDTMEGRFPVAFVALTIISEINRELARPRTFTDGRKKTLPGHTYSWLDVVNKTRSITLSYGLMSKKFWLGNHPKKELPKICLACGTKDAYALPLPFIGNPMDLRRG